MTGFRWTTQRETAARLVADDLVTDDQIAAECGVSRQALANWKKAPEFQARVEEHLAATRAAILSAGIAERQNRIDAYNDRWNRMRQVIEERAADPVMQDVPGGRTGLLVHQTKAIGTGANQTIIDEYAFDAALVRELRAHEEQAAKELGQWIDKQEHSGKDGAAVFTILIDRNDDDGDDE